MRDPVDTAALEQAAQQEIERGLTACQVAVARDNEMLFTRSFGSAAADTRFWIASDIPLNAVASSSRSSPLRRRMTVS